MIPVTKMGPERSMVAARPKWESHHGQCTSVKTTAEKVRLPQKRVRSPAPVVDASRTQLMSSPRLREEPLEQSRDRQVLLRRRPNKKKCGDRERQERRADDLWEP